MKMPLAYFSIYFSLRFVPVIIISAKVEVMRLGRFSVILSECSLSRCF